ncbi:hypothetical protein ACIGBL_24065 [Streptomyces sp. NPDC085614]|uniref:hypothetical protein n=1 Tax=unclassified Streptomyces TaxID=2593676 RepID=UPI0011CDA9B6|nr:hypothetical protein [Streptomyces sp. ms191]
MIAVALLLPPLLLGLVLALDRYEDHMSASARAPRHARRLRLVPDPPQAHAQEPPLDASAPSERAA